MQGGIVIAFFGDTVGQPGRRVLQQAITSVRELHRPHAIIVNGENLRNGSGITAELYKGLRDLGVDGVTLGDHAFRDPRITPVLEDPSEPIARPANLSIKAPGKRWIRIPKSAARPRDIFVVTVLGRVFMTLHADDPFAAVDAVIASLPEPSPLVIVEAHMEATSEKAALAHYLDGRVAAVIGSHTHVPTADARILPRGTAFITDVGMCGPYASIIGRDPTGVLRAMTTGVHTNFEMGEGGERACGCLVEIDVATGRAIRIERLDFAADTTRAPFVTR
ncbi:MAG: YmdB family metallophosphoesterase [Phycisphaerales bacterium]|nr:YmdB family metallophosphoesterase [Phycisphaerales bacterium]